MRHVHPLDRSARAFEPARRFLMRPEGRVAAWWSLLATLSLADLALTVAALDTIPGAHELNPLARLALETSLLGATLLKVAALLVVLVLGCMLARGGHDRLTQRLIGAWCLAFLALDLYSAVRLVGGF